MNAYEILAQRNKMKQQAALAPLGAGGIAQNNTNQTETKSLFSQLVGKDTTDVLNDVLGDSSNNRVLKGAAYLGLNVASGFASSIEGIWDWGASGLTKLVGEATGIDALTKFAEDNLATDWFDYSAPDEWYKPTSTAMKIAGEVAQGIGTTLPSLLAVGVATVATAASGGTASPALMAALGGTVSAFGAAGNAVKQAYLESGELGAEQFGYGAAVGATEGVVEGVSSLLGAGTGKVVKAVSGNAPKLLSKGIGKTILSLGGDMLSEGTEEVVAEALDPVYKRMTYDENAEWATPEQLIHAGLVGALSGLAMTGSMSTVNITTDTVRGQNAYNRGETATILKEAQAHVETERKSKTGSEIYEAIEETYDKLEASLAKTNGEVKTLDQKRMVGALRRMNVSATMAPMMYHEAANIIANADTIASRIESGVITDENGNKLTITAEAIREGFDPNNPKSIAKAIKNNSVLRALTAQSVSGKIMYNTDKFAQEMLTGGKPLMETEYNAFLESANQDELNMVGENLGITDWSAETDITVNERLRLWNESGKADVYRKKIDSLKKAKTIEAKTVEDIPTPIRLGKGKMARYKTDNADIAIENDNNTFYIYDLGLNWISMPLSRAETNKALRQYNEGQKALRSENMKPTEAVEIKEVGANESLAMPSNTATQPATATTENVTEKPTEAKQTETKTSEKTSSKTKYQLEAEQNDALLRDKLGENYTKLTEPNKGMIRKIMRQAKAKGMSEADALTLARISAHSGVDIKISKEMCMRYKLDEDGNYELNENGKRLVWYADGYYDPSTGKIVVNPEATRADTPLLIHEFFHASTKSSNGTRHKRTYNKLLKLAKESLTDEQIKEIEDRYGKVYDGNRAKIDEDIIAESSEIFASEQFVESLVSKEPNIAKRMISFFKGASDYYADDKRLSKQARKFYKLYKQLYNSLSEQRQNTNASSVAVGVGDERFALPETDSEGKRLSYEQRKYFENTKVVDENGNLLLVYHGTRKADFTEFKRNVNYFTNSSEMAESYAPSGEKFAGYLSITKPYTIDAKGAKWSQIPIDSATKTFLDERGASTFKESGEWRTTPADIASAVEEAVDEGEADYDGVIILNVDDTGSYYKTNDTNIANDYIIFKSSQFKNADNRNPTTNSDIRFSVPKNFDKDYLEAVERGDMETAQKMVDEAAKKAGYTIKSYHGTKNDFTVFDKSKIGSGVTMFASQGRGFYFTESESVATKYSNGGKVLSSYLKANNLFSFVDKKNENSNRLLDEFAHLNGETFDIKQYSGFVDFEKRTGSILSRVVKDKGEAFTAFLQDKGFDGILYTSYDYDTGGSNKTYVVFEPEQIKTADPVTYDDNGNVIPLSERFNPKKPDIRFAVPKNANGIEIYTEEEYNVKELYTSTDNFVQEVSPSDRSSFARSLANKTSNMVEGEIKTLTIYGAGKVYLFRADGYMSGEMIKTFDAKNKEMLESIENEYDTIDQSPENASLWTETVQSLERGSFIPGGVFGRERSNSADILYANSPERNGTGSNERSRSDFKYDKAETDELIKKLKEIYNIKYSLPKNAKPEPLEIPDYDVAYGAVAEQTKPKTLMDYVATAAYSTAHPVNTAKTVLDWTGSALIGTQIAFVNEQAGYENAMKRMGRTDGEATVQAVRAASNRAQEMLGATQAIKQNGKLVEVGDGWQKIVSRIKKYGENAFDLFEHYLFHKHNIDRMSLEERSIAKNEADKQKLDGMRKTLEDNKREIAIINAKLDELKGIQTRAATIERAPLKEKRKALLAENKALAPLINTLQKKVDNFVPEQNKPVLGKNVNGENVAITAEESKKIVEQYERDFAWMLEESKAVKNYLDNLMKERLDAGLISEQLYLQLQEKYPNYVPTYRTETKQGTSGIGGKYDLRVNKTIKTAKGGLSQLESLDKSIGRMTMQVIRASEINRMGEALVEAAESDPSKNRYIELTEDKQAETLEQSLEEAEGNAKQVITTNQVTIYRGGEKYSFRVTPQVFAAFNAFNSQPSTPYISVELMAVGNTLFKRLVTSLNPFFTVRNFQRDFKDAIFNSRHPVQFVRNYARAINEISRNGSYWRMYREAGGLSASVFDYQKGLTSKPTKHGFTASENKLIALITSMERLNMAIEQMPRLAEFISSVEAGSSINQALLNAADVTTNFARSGKITKHLNRTIIPFLNPAIQGTSKLFRNFSDAFDYKHPRQMAKAFAILTVKAAILGVIPMVFNQFLYDDDEEYNNLRDSDKENYFLFKIGDTFFKLPRGRVQAAIAGITNRTMQELRGEDADWSDYASSVVSNLTPVENFSRPIWAPLQDFKNNTTWYGGQIEGQQFENTRPRDRYDESTSSIAIAIGQVTGHSPKKIHYLIDQYSGVIGDFLLPLTTQKAERNVVLGNFTIDPVSSNKLSDDFYDIYEDVQYRKTDGDVTAKYQLKYMNDVKSAISTLYDEKAKIQKSDLSDGEKLQQTRVVQALINQTYQSFLDSYDTYTDAIKATQGVIDETDESQVKLRYAEINRQTFGAAKALEEYNKSVYESATMLNKAGMSYDTYYNLYFSTLGLASDTDEDGSAISGSKRAKILSAINATNADIKQKMLYFAYKGYSIKDGDFNRLSAKRANKILLNYILSQKNLTKAEKTELAEKCGFKVKNGKIITQK